jgi:hypothetical protein
MDGNGVMYMEIAFNIMYLVVIYGFIHLMARRMGKVDQADKAVARRFLAAFVLLAAGDTGHVGFRVVAFGLGGLEDHPVLVGLGALATSVTVTGFYMLMVEIWRVRFGENRKSIYWFLLSMGVLRLVFMTFPGNDWGQIVPPQAFSYIRNSFLTILGVGIAVLFLRDGLANDERMYVNIAYAMFASYLFYIPVILFVQQVPMLGMLMIPKTIAYLAMAFIGYRRIFVMRNPKGRDS